MIPGEQSGVPCGCGCGEETLVGSNFTPNEYVHGHNGRRDRDDMYDIVDTGYETSCWLWDGYIGANGYAVVGLGEGRAMGAHAWFYERQNGPVPDGMQVDHLCYQRHCMNPDHMETVTPAENSRRKRTAKLTVGKVQRIKRLVAEVVPTLEVRDWLATEMGCHRSTIGDVIAGRTWRGV